MTVASSSTPISTSPPSAFANATRVRAMSVATSFFALAVFDPGSPVKALLNSRKWLSPTRIASEARSSSPRASTSTFIKRPPLRYDAWRSIQFSIDTSVRDAGDLRGSRSKKFGRRSLVGGQSLSSSDIPRQACRSGLADKRPHSEREHCAEAEAFTLLGKVCANCGCTSTSRPLSSAWSRCSFVTGALDRPRDRREPDDRLCEVLSRQPCVLRLDLVDR